MIRLENLSKSFHTRWGRKVVIDDASVTFPSGVSVALLARNGAGKSTLMGMIGGTIQPSSGRIVKSGTVSWPVGFRGSFHRDMTGAQNTRFVARIYGVETQELLVFVEDFAELGPHFHSPVRTYSAGMMSRLAFGVSIGIPFDTYYRSEPSRERRRAWHRGNTRNQVVCHCRYGTNCVCDLTALREIRRRSWHSCRVQRDLIRESCQRWQRIRCIRIERGQSREIKTSRQCRKWVGETRRKGW